MPLEELWEADVFTLSKMRDYLPKNVFKLIENVIKNRTMLDVSLVPIVATAIKAWAISKEASHFAHVFHPLDNFTAHKYDAISEFTDKALVQGEPDGSSFPNGDIRSTFESRAYTVWDVTSPPYVTKIDNVVTLCIPAVFISYLGESLDKKMVLLRSATAMNKAVTRLLKQLDCKEVATVNSSCGAEQEYFLVYNNLAKMRPDLLQAGRTLFGLDAAKGQQFDDYYLRTIPKRVQVFMQDVDEQLYRLGILIKTRHNEVAPCQFELAPSHEEANVASDHQQKTMTILKETAKKHGFMCLLHEKPFKGINGSGKHVNWSIYNTTQGNLFDPGDNPHTNWPFLLMIGAMIRGVHIYGRLLRAVVATAGNDHRLGANEAPPAIISVYLGQQLEDVFSQIQQGKITGSAQAEIMSFDVLTLPEFSRDPGDRNRTSPFAFTGNRFEFRSVGSNQLVSDALVALNTILTDSVTWVTDQLEAQLANGIKLETAVYAVVKEIMDVHGNVVFGGDGYSEAWQKTAVEKRGLLNLPTTADALLVFQDQDIRELFTRTGVLTARELESRFNVYAEQYIKVIEMETNIVIDLVKTRIFPAAYDYLLQLSNTIINLKEIGITLEQESVKTVAFLINQMMDAVKNLDNASGQDNSSSLEEHMWYCAKTLLPMMNQVREYADALEGEVADNLWPFPKYQEMLLIE